MGRQRTAVVTGSSTGIGFETSLLLARNGFYTYATMRDSNKSKQIKEIAKRENLPLDILFSNVDDCHSVKKTIQKILDRSKQIDILVNNAGYGLFGALEDISIEEIKKQFETNLFGATLTEIHLSKKVRLQGTYCYIGRYSISAMMQ